MRTITVLQACFYIGHQAFACMGFMMLVVILHELCRWSLVPVYSRFGCGLAVDEKCGNNHYVFAIFKFKNADLRITLLHCCCCLVVDLSKSLYFLAKSAACLLTFDTFLKTL